MSSPFVGNCGSNRFKTRGASSKCRTIHASEGGEWDYDRRLKSAAEALIRYGWLKAILEGHARVAEGLNVGSPVLVLASTRSVFARKWSDDMKRADVVLDVEQIATRAVRLGPLVTVVRIEDAVHDVLLSPEPVRARAFDEIARWLQAYAEVAQQNPV